MRRYPHAYRKEVGGCPAGSSTPSQTECMHAAGEALATGGEPYFDAPSSRHKELSVGAWAHLPSGCIVKTGTAQVMFNTASGKGHMDYKLVCKKSTLTAEQKEAADFADHSNASGLLCSRKRASCFWGDKAANCHTGFDYGGHLTQNVYWWTEEPCRLQVQVGIDGGVSVVHPGSKSTRRVGINSGNWFRVRWLDGKFPKAVSSCGSTPSSTCVVVASDTGESCVCEVSMETSTVYTDAASIPSKAAVLEALRIGAPAPGAFANGTYTLCGTAACKDRAPEVEVYTRGTAATPALDERAIFVVVVNGTRTLHLANKHSVVRIASSTDPAAFSFRNPPQMMPLVDPSQRDALYETEALIDHLFYHQNVAPFVAMTLIQKLVTSNPSPRYVAAVAAAFATGAHDGRTYSGKYGDVGAAAVAVLLDREARSLVLAADPTHGQIREPLLRVLHFLRAMELTAHRERNIELDEDLQTKIGQAVYRAPNVFAFFSPQFVPEGAVQASGLRAPEAQLNVLPFVIGYLDAITSLVFDGQCCSCRYCRSR